MNTKNENQQIKLLIPYDVNRNEIKALGGKWNKQLLKWQTNADNIELVDKYELVYLKNVKYADKDYIKQYDGNWDVSTRMWYTYKSNTYLTTQYEYETYDEANIIDLDKIETIEVEEISQSIEDNIQHITNYNFTIGNLFLFGTLDENIMNH